MKASDNSSIQIATLLVWISPVPTASMSIELLDTSAEISITQLRLYCVCIASARIARSDRYIGDNSRSIRRTRRGRCSLAFRVRGSGTRKRCAEAVRGSGARKRHALRVIAAGARVLLFAARPLP